MTQQGTAIRPRPVLPEPLHGDGIRLAQLVDLQQALLLPSLDPRVVAERLVHGTATLLGAQGAAVGMVRDHVYEILAATGTGEVARAAYDRSPDDTAPLAAVLGAGRALVVAAGPCPGPEIILPLQAPGVAGALHLVLTANTVVNAEIAQLARTTATIAAAALANAIAWERANATARVRHDVLAAMAHDLRAPLAALLGYAQLLGDGTFGPLTAEQGDAVATIGRQGRELNDLIGATLDLVRHDSGRLAVRAESFAVTDVVETLRAGTFAGPTAAGTVAWRLAPDLPQLETDRMKVKEILQNLVDNALKHGRAPVEVDVVVLPGGDAIRCIVRDHGPGIAAHVQRRLFEPYRSGTARGTGLGLYIVRCFAEALGGGVAARSTPGEGTTITVELPRVAPRASTSRPDAGA
ncbi:MAG: HAMP domain-containing sensor histidine kinase [Candidatus Binatia bacterium]